jgi:hypothetical protein
VTPKRVLIIFYSYTQQTKIQLKQFIAGLESAGVEVIQERLQPIQPFEFPFKSNFRLISAMLMTFFQRRMAISPISERCRDNWDCIILAGPTWSYNPSGPILDFLDRYGKDICGGQKVVPFISCRAYWRIHYWVIKLRLKRYGSKVLQPIVFLHPHAEPWRVIGLVLQLRGKILSKNYSWLRRHYPSYGHSREQGLEAHAAGQRLATQLEDSFL